MSKSSSSPPSRLVASSTISWVGTGTPSALMMRTRVLSRAAPKLVRMQFTTESITSSRVWGRSGISTASAAVATAAAIARYPD